MRIRLAVAALALLPAGAADAQTGQWDPYGNNRAAVRTFGSGVSLWLSLDCDAVARGGDAVVRVTVTDPWGETTPAQRQDFRRLAAGPPDRDGTAGAIAVNGNGTTLSIVALRRFVNVGGYEFRATAGADVRRNFARASDLLVRIGSHSFRFGGGGSRVALEAAGCVAAAEPGAAAAAAAGPYPAEPLFAVGQLVAESELRRRYPADGRGWANYGGSMVDGQSDRNTLLFSSQGRPARFHGYLYEAVRRGPQGEHEIMRVLARGSTAAAPGEVQAFDCPPRGVQALVALVDERSRRVHGLVVRGGTIVEERWTMASAANCEVGVD